MKVSNILYNLQLEYFYQILPLDSIYFNIF
jgi:hypothetical protein